MKSVLIRVIRGRVFAFAFTFAVLKLTVECGFPHALALSTVTTFSTGYSKAVQASSPPSSGRTRVMPRFCSCSATRALVASLGQVQ